MTGGFVQALWRFPVLGMAGEPLRSTQVDARGVAGDRQHYVAGPEGQLSVQDLPALAHWQARFPFNPDGSVQTYKEPPYPMLEGPDEKSFLWGDPRLEHALRRSLGRSIDLVRDLDATRGVIVATVQPELDRAVAGVNVQLALKLPERGGWAGAELSFRDGVRLKLVASRADGPGIEARVVQTGRIVLGEPVALS